MATRWNEEQQQRQQDHDQEWNPRQQGRPYEEEE